MAAVAATDGSSLGAELLAWLSDQLQSSATARPTASAENLQEAAHVPFYAGLTSAARQRIERLR
ncbi:hypothetical protein [Streptomyces sirii]|uniref:hypothetical protein n=1 Tax=Streptomyces sirii TaxID=3127701 RepID=UPI003D360403